MPADVAEVHVVVVADEVLLADGPEQGAVRRERLHPGLVQSGQHLLGGVQQRLGLLGVAGVEHGGDPVGLVDAQRPARPRRRRRSGCPWCRGAPPRRTPRGRRRARRPTAAWCPSRNRLSIGGHSARPSAGVAHRPERPDPTTVEEHVDDGVLAGPEVHADVVDAVDPGLVGHPAQRSTNSLARVRSSSKSTSTIVELRDVERLDPQAVLLDRRPRCRARSSPGRRPRPAARAGWPCPRRR